MDWQGQTRKHWLHNYLTISIKNIHGEWDNTGIGIGIGISVLVYFEADSGIDYRRYFYKLWLTACWSVGHTIFVGELPELDTKLRASLF